MSEMNIEVVYALPEKQYLQRLTLPQGSNVEQAIERSGLLNLRSEIDLSKNKVGIFSRPVKLNDPLHDGDRVEIYRPLIADPRECAASEPSAPARSNTALLSGIKKAPSAPFSLFFRRLTISRCRCPHPAVSCCCRCRSGYRYR